jgi:hypothetical protein
MRVGVLDDMGGSTDSVSALGLKEMDCFENNFRKQGRVCGFKKSSYIISL